MSLPVETPAELREIAARYPRLPPGTVRPAPDAAPGAVRRGPGHRAVGGHRVHPDRHPGITAAEVSGVATFYTMYKRRPVGDYHVGSAPTRCAR